jgi:inner membrane protein
MVSGRLSTGSSRARLPVTLVAFSLLAMLPDIDVLWVSLGVPDRGLAGHRGLTHTPAFALTVALLAGGLALWRGRPRAWRIAIVTALVLGSHGILDALAQDGRGIMFLWPLLDHRYHFPWRPIPDAPTGLAFFSAKGMYGLGLELLYFLPFTLYALTPRGWIRRRPSRVPSLSPTANTTS